MIDKDPINNAINEGIRRSININLDNKCFGAAIILIFAGIDAMSCLNREEEKDYNDSIDFKIWVEKYFHVFGQTKITPEEWWAARNAIIHTYGAYSKLHNEQDVRVLSWMVKALPNIIYNPKIDKDLVLVDILAMRDAFFTGMENFLIESFADSTRKQIMEDRISKLIMTLPSSNS
ncbi:MAG TPA: hypothetical protein VIK14_14800 [Ignavibacteria bacterium]